jgi:hypothetical protein
LRLRPLVPITGMLLKLSLLALEPITGRPLKLSPLPLEHRGIAPWRLRGEGPTTRLIRPGQGVWRA